jgi:ribosomal protein S18 acetylase RimI-like enzyme
MRPATSALVLPVPAQLGGHSSARRTGIGADVEPEHSLDDEWSAVVSHRLKAIQGRESTRRVGHVNVRVGREDDAAAIAAVFIASFETLDFLPTLHTHAEHHAFIRDLVARGEVWIAEEDGRILAMAALAGDVLGQLYVDPDAQRCGVGSALVDKVKQLRPAGFTCWVFQQNTIARAFYESHGCRVVRLTDGSDNDEKRPDALYEWRPER